MIDLVEVEDIIKVSDFHFCIHMSKMIFYKICIL